MQSRTHLKLRGVTLVETVISGSAIAVGLLAVAASLVPAQRTSDAAIETGAAAHAAASLLDEARSASFATLAATFDGTVRALPGAIPHASSDAVATFTVADEAGGGNSRWPVRRVTVDITWNTVRGAQSVSVATLVSDRTAAAGGGGP